MSLSLSLYLSLSLSIYLSIYLSLSLSLYVYISTHSYTVICNYHTISSYHLPQAQWDDRKRKERAAEVQIAEGGAAPAASGDAEANPGLI